MWQKTVIRKKGLKNFFESRVFGMGRSIYLKHEYFFSRPNEEIKSTQHWGLTHSDYPRQKHFLYLASSWWSIVKVHIFLFLLSCPKPLYVRYQKTIRLRVSPIPFNMARDWYTTRPKINIPNIKVVGQTVVIRWSVKPVLSQQWHWQVGSRQRQVAFFTKINWFLSGRVLPFIILSGTLYRDTHPPKCFPQKNWETRTKKWTTPLPQPQACQGNGV